MHRSNSYHGHDFILAWYCGRREPSEIFGLLQHGWIQADSIGVPRHWPSRAPLLMWSEEEARKIMPGDAKTVVVGAPFLYLLQILDRTVPSMGQMSNIGTLVYPQHATQKRVDLHVRLADYVVKHCNPPFVANLHISEFRSPGVVNAYESRGLHVQSIWRSSGRAADVPHDPLRLVRQLALLQSASEVVSNSVSTVVWYAAAIGKRVSVVDLGDGLGVEADRHAAYLNPGPDDRRFHISRSTAERVLGLENLLEPEALQQALGWTSSPRVAVARAARLLRDALSGKGIL